jgi:hypothetical protein
MKSNVKMKERNQKRHKENQQREQLTDIVICEFPFEQRKAFRGDIVLWEPNVGESIQDFEMENTSIFVGKQGIQQIDKH